MDKLVWWGYIHTNGKLQIKRFFGKEDLTEAAESPFVVRVIGPVDADTREEAENKLRGT